MGSTPGAIAARLDDRPLIELVDLMRSDVGALARAQVLLMAIGDAASKRCEVPHVADLAFLAYLESAESIALLAREGVFIDPLADLSFADRNRWAMRSMVHLGEARSHLSNDEKCAASTSSTPA